MRPRPQVAYRSSEPADVVLDRFRSALQADGCPCTGHVGKGEVSLHVAEPRRTRWSPWLSLEVRPGDGGCTLRGTFGPQPALWTMFVFLYTALVFAWGAGMVYTLVAYPLTGDLTGLYATGGATVGLALACGTDLSGRRIGEGQMGLVRGFIGTVVPRAVDEDLAA
jgi:hypothetical protein